MASFQIIGERINIGFLTKGSIPSVLDFYSRNQARIRLYNPEVPAEYGSAQYWENRVRVRNSCLKRERALDFYLFLPDRPDRIIGHIRLSNIEGSPRNSAEIGYTIDLLLEGGGYMAEALGLALRFAKEGLTLHRIVAFCHRDNNRSRKLLQALGFREEGVSREALWIHGEWQDMLLYALIL